MALYSSPEDALKKLQEFRGYWGNNLSNLSFQLSFAVIATVFVVFKPEEAVKNAFAMGAVGIALIGLVVNHIAASVMMKRINAQISRARSEPEVWETEFKAHGNRDSDWPFTAQINALAKGLIDVKTWFPLVASALLVCGVVMKVS